MSRKRLLTRGVAIGYLALLAQIFYSLASIPLALSYLSRAEFGMFSVVLAVISYLGLAEFGMTQGFNRHLFECKDGTDPARYGRYFMAGMMALGGVALFILILGTGAIFLTAPFFRIPQDLLADYHWIMFGMVLVAFCHMATRMLCTPLYVHQRHDLMQFSQLCQYGIMYLLLFHGLKAGWGVYALLANHIAAFLWSFCFSVICCLRLGLYPRRGCWSLPHPEEWRSVLRYSRDMFIFQLGTKLAAGMPMLLLPRLLGLDAVAIWTVCSRPFSILKQFVSKPYEYALPMLCEMYARKETQRVAKRWCQVTQIIATLSVCGFAIAAAHNTLFIRLWTGGKIHWDSGNDWLLALKFLTVIAGVAAMGSIGFRKRMGNVRFVPFLEAALLLVNALWMTRLWGISGLLLAGVLAPLFGGISLGIRYLAAITHQNPFSLAARTFGRPLLLLPLAGIAAWGSAYLQQMAPGYFGLILAAATGSLLVAALGFFIGFSPDARHEFLQLAMKPLGRWRVQRR